MRFQFSRFGVGTVAALTLFGAAGMAQASSLTSVQVNAIIGLLQSFGADQSVINNVSASLRGTAPSSALTCSSFSDVSYGNFDNNPGGRVSQLQTWLGISSSTFGFGTFGNKTQAAWDVKCGETQQNIGTFKLTPSSGRAPLTVSFGGATTDFVADKIDFGDGSSIGLNAGYCSPNICSASHTYSSSGTYTAKLIDLNSGQTVGTTIITVTAGY